MAKDKASQYDIQSFNHSWEQNPTDGKPQNGKQVRQFLGKKHAELDNSKVGYRYEDAANDRYLYFANETNCNLYLSDPETYSTLLMWTMPMQKAYTAEIYMTTPLVNNVLSTTTDNYLEYTFAVLNRQGVASGDSAIVTYTITSDSGNTSTVTEIYEAGTTVRFKLDNYLADGGNRIQIALKGRTTLAATTASVTWNMIALEFSAEMDITEAHAPGETFSFNVRAKGSGSKYIETYLDGQDISSSDDVITALDGNRTKSVSLSSDITPGVHTLQLRAYLTSGSTRFYSKTESFQFAVTGSNDVLVLFSMTLDAPTTTPVLAVQQYGLLSLPFAIYDPLNRTCSVAFKTGTTVIATRSMTNGRKETFSYSPTNYGTTTVTAEVQGSSYTLSLNVSKSNVNMEKATANLQFEVSAKGRSNSDTDKDVWQSGGFVAQFNQVSWNALCGWNEDALVLSNGATVKFVGLTPLSGNVSTAGMTLEIDYMVEDGNANDDAVILDLTNDSGAGIKMTPTYVDVKSATGRGFRHLTMTGKRKRMAIVINRNTTDVNKNIFMTVVNGKVGYSQNYTEGNPFPCSNEFLFGDTTGSSVVRLYGVKYYNRALSVEECLGNHAVESGNVVEIANRNDICVEGSSRLSFEKTKLKVASMRLIGDIQKLLSVQDKTTQITAEVDYYDPNDITKCWHAVGVKIKNQGTSTLKFPVKNFSLNFSNAIFYDIFGNVIEMSGIKLHALSAAVKKLVAKCDYMESSSSFNTSGAVSFNDSAFNVLVDGEYVLRTAAQKYAVSHGVTRDIRIAIDGVPIAMFYQQTSTSEEVCLGQYNLNNGKDDCPEVYGFSGLTGFDSSKTERWELAEEGGLCAFTAAAYANFDTTYGDYFESVWGNSSPANLKRLCGWLASLDNGDGTYNVTKFNSEYASYLDLWKTAHYYIHIFVKNMGVDQVAKNMHLMTEDSNVWFPIYYDGDSAKLNDNDGYQFEDLYADRQTKDASGNYYFQAHDSVFWNVLEASEVFMAIVRQLAQLEYNTGFNYESEVRNYITEHTALFPERVINQNMEAKYFDIFRSTGGNTNYLYVCQGDKEERVRLIADRRLKRYEALWGFGGYSNRVFNFRLITGNDLTTEAATVKSFDEYWYGYSSNGNMISSGVKLTAGQSHDFVIGAGRANGDILRLHATDHMSELDMSAILRALYSFEVPTAAGAIHLKKLILGSNTSSNAVVSQINGLGYLTGLEQLDIRNMSGITALEGLDNLKAFRNLSAEGSSLGVFKPAQGVSMEHVSLPGTIRDIVLNEASISHFEYTPNDTLSHVELKQVTGLNSYALVNAWLAALEGKSEMLNNAYLEIDNVNWTADSTFLLKLAQIGSGSAQSLKLNGKVVLTDSMTQELYNQLTAVFGPNCFNATARFYIQANDAVLISSNKTTVGSGDSFQLTGTVFPDATKTCKFHMYHNGTLVQETDDTATYNGVTLNCVTGAVTTSEVSADFSLAFAAYTATATSTSLTVTIQRTIRVSSFEIQGVADIILKAGEETGYSLNPLPANATVGIASIVVEIVEL